MFTKFLEDQDAWDMFVTGIPGTGKTWSMKDYVVYCIEHDISYVVCAYTHDACAILRARLPIDANIQTLHKFLRKRPTINTEAKKVHNIETNMKMGVSEKPTIMFIDEFSMIGENDLMDLRSLQDPDYDGAPTMKIVWFGDTNQLPPVKDQEAVIPHKPYWIKLTEIKRTDNPLLQNTIIQLNDMINEDIDIGPLKRHSAFIETKELLPLYIKDTSSKVLLAYTNKRVQELNFAIEQREEPRAGDALFCPTNNQCYTFVQKVDKASVAYIDRLWDSPLMFNSKYKTLEFLLELNICDFYMVKDLEGEPFVYPVVFGTYNFKGVKDKFGLDATAINNEIKTKHKADAGKWAAANYSTPLARKRSLAWRKYLTLKDTVLCFDFAHAKTVHKSQGSTYETVYLDAQDLYQCASRDLKLYLRLFYVAVSRASKCVYTN